MSYCYSNDGDSMRAVDPTYDPQAGEVIFDRLATDDDLDTVFPGRAARRVMAVRALRLAEVRANADILLAQLTASYPAGELQSWGQQAKEADALLENSAAHAPLLSAIAAARGMPVGDLAVRVRAKVAAYSAQAGAIIGRRQALEDAIDGVDLAAPDAAAQLAAIEWPRA